MFAGFEIECLAGYEQQYREAVVYPAMARRAQQEVELELLRRSRPGTRSSALLRLAARAMRLGGQPATAPVTRAAPGT